MLLTRAGGAALGFSTTMPGCAAPPVGPGVGAVTGEGKIDGIGSGAFLSHSGGIDISRLVDGQRRDFFFGGAVKHEAFTAGLDLVHQSTAVRARDQIALRIHRQHPNVGFVAFEKYGMLAPGSHAKDFAVIAGGHVQIAGIVENQVPYVFRPGIEIYGGREFAGRLGGLRLLCPWLPLPPATRSMRYTLPSGLVAA